MTNSKLIALLSLSLIGCITEMGDPDDPTLSEEEQGLTGSANLSFVTGYGEGYLSPVPETRTGVAEGMLGWIEPAIYNPILGWVNVPAFKTKVTTVTDHVGDVYLKFTGTIPATGTCALSAGALIVHGATHVEGSNPFPYTGSTDASARADVIVKGWVGGAFKYYKTWQPGIDSTKSEVRTKTFDKRYYLSNGPTFYGTAGQRIDLEIKLHNFTRADSGEGVAWVSIYQFGFLANTPNNIVSISCY